MQSYVKFISKLFLRSFVLVFFIMLGLVFILNILTELDFFRKTENVESYLPLYLSAINTPSHLFEMFPFIFLLSTQLFFINLINDNQIQIFKYSGLKNTKILLILSILTFIISTVLVTIFYNASANLKNFYLELKSNYTTDDKYLAVITKNGLWIKDKIDNKTLIIKATKIDQNFLVDCFISIFDENYNIIKNIKSDKIDISKNEWEIYEARVFEDNYKKKLDKIYLKTSFNYKLIQSLFSNLSSLSLPKLFELKKNYELLNYSTTEISIQIQKLISYPVYLMLMTILSGIIMFNIKSYGNPTLMISIGLFLSVIIYYISNFFHVLGNTEKIPIILSVWIPIIVLATSNSLMMIKINEK
jgi:lipopolysaccharide export system permease protein